MSEEEIKQCLESAVNIKLHSYSPYSKFRVGCCIMGDNNKLYHGVNVEIVSYPSTCCAEHSAVTSMVTDGCQKIRLVALATDVQNGLFTWPCGNCRQIIMEFADTNVKVYTINNDNEIRNNTMGYLLPSEFEKDQLGNLQ